MNVNSWGNTGVGTEIGYQRSGLSARKEQDKWFRLESVAHLLMVWSLDQEDQVRIAVVFSYLTPLLEGDIWIQARSQKKNFGGSRIVFSNK